MVYGSMARLNDTSLEITELPVRCWTQTYKENVLEVMLHGTEKESPFIRLGEVYCMVCVMCLLCLCVMCVLWLCVGVELGLEYGVDPGMLHILCWHASLIFVTYSLAEIFVCTHVGCSWN